MAKRFVMRPDHGLIIRVKKALSHRVDIPNVFGPVTEDHECLAIDEDVSLFHQIVNVKDARGSRRNPLDKTPAPLQLELGFPALGNIARNGLKARDPVAVENQLNVLAEPAFHAVPVNNRKLMVGALLLSPELAQIEALDMAPFILPDQFQ